MASTIKRDAAASYTNLFVSIAVGFLLVPIIESHIGKSYFGIYQFIFTLTAYSAIMNMGLTKTVERYVAKSAVRGEQNQENLIVSMVISIYLLAAAVLIVLIAVLYHQFGNIFAFKGNEMVIAKQCFLIASINATLNIPAMTFLAHLKGRGRYFITYNLHTVFIVCRMVVIIGLLQMGFGIVAVFVTDLVLNQTLNFSYALYSISKYKLKLVLFHFEGEMFRKLFHFTLFISLGAIADLLYYNTDNIILGIMSTSDVIAEYALSQRLITYFIRYTTAFTGLLLPRFMEAGEEVAHHERNHHLGIAFQKITRIHGFIMSFAMVNFIVFGRDVIYLWVGSEFPSTYLYTVILLAPMWIVFSQVAGIEILYVIKKHQIRLIVYLFNAAVNIVLTVWLVGKMGAIGAAISTSVTLVAGSIVFLNIYYSRLFKYELWPYLWKAFGVNLLTSLLMIGAGSSYNSLMDSLFGYHPGILHLGLRGILYNIVFGLVIYYLWLSHEEKSYVKRLLIRK